MCAASSTALVRATIRPDLDALAEPFVLVTPCSDTHSDESTTSLGNTTTHASSDASVSFEQEQQRLACALRQHRWPARLAIAANSSLAEVALSAIASRMASDAAFFRLRASATGADELALEAAFANMCNVIQNCLEGRIEERASVAWTSRGSRALLAVSVSAKKHSPPGAHARRSYLLFLCLDADRGFVAQGNAAQYRRVQDEWQDGQTSSKHPHTFGLEVCF